jgi:hypothetical protein
MALDEGLQAFTGKGRVHHTSVIAVIAYLIEEAGESSGRQDRRAYTSRIPARCCRAFSQQGSIRGLMMSPRCVDEMDVPPCQSTPAFSSLQMND